MSNGLPLWASALALALAVGVAAACDEGTVAMAPLPGAGSVNGPGADVQPTGTLPCAVDAVLESSCRKCHSASPQFGAPMPLVTFGDLHAPARSDSSKKVYELVAARIADDAKPMPQPPNPRLSAADRDVLTAWAKAGAPSDPSGCAPPPAVPPPTPASDLKCTPNLSIGPAAPYVMPDAAFDDYVCYGVDIPAQAKPTHVVGFAAHPDNTKIIHHILLFQAESSHSPTPQRCGIAGDADWRLLMGWAPGMKPFELPPEAGFPLSTTDTTHYVVHIHYANPQGLPGQKDGTGFDLCTEAPRPNEADVLLFGTQTISIPPGNYSTTCRWPVPAPLANAHFIAALPHMHALGKSMSTTLFPASGGPPVDMGTNPSYQLGNQLWYPLSAVAHENDVISTTCSWVNNTGGFVSFGVHAYDEMCYSFTAYWPKAPSITWTQPARESQCE